MNPAAEQPDSTDESRRRGPCHAVDLALHESMLRRAGRTPTPAGAPRSACRAPSHVLVVDGDHGFRACEHSDQRLQGTPGDPRTIWNGADLAELRATLGSGNLPLDHCRGCVRWHVAAMARHAPPVLVYGDLPAAAPAAHPSHVVLRVPSTGDFDPPTAASLPALLHGCAHVTVSTSCSWHERTSWFSALQAAATPPAMTLAWHGHEPPTLQPRDGLRLTRVEWTTSNAELAAMQSFRASCREAGVDGHVRFVLTPQEWFRFEEVVLAASAAGLTAEWAVLDRDARVPLAEITGDDLTLVKNIVANTWERLGGKAHPTAVGEHAIHDLVEQLRRLLQHRLQSQNPALAATPLSLPPFDHPWFRDPMRSHWGWEQLLQHSHLDRVVAHLLDLTRSGTLSPLAAEAPGPRILLQRYAYERRSPEFLTLLRELYRLVPARAALVAEDQAFAAKHDLARFGGPWAHHLGLDHQEVRRRPFEVGKIRRPKAGSTPNVTVIVPSFQHGPYIEATLRSVLGQRHTNFKLLVVDDRSEDDTVERARSIQDPRLEVRVNERNLGLGNSVLAALQFVDTPYVALLNSDDLFHPERLGRCCKVLDEHQDVNLVTTKMHLVDAEGGELTTANASLAIDGQQVFDWVHWFANATPRGELDADEIFAALLERNFLATSSNLVCRTDWLRGHAESLRSLKYCLDWQLFLDAARERSHHHIGEPLVAYRLHATNTVWFRGGRRWAFYLEVNRVVAGALRDRIRGIEPPTARVAELLRLVSGPVLRNRECDGVALFVNTIVDAVEADGIAAASPDIQSELARLNEAALSTLALRDAASASTGSSHTNLAERHLGDLARELLPLEEGRADRIQVYADSLEIRIRECWEGRGTLEHEKSVLLQREQELVAAVQRTRQELASTSERLQLEAKATSERLQLEAKATRERLELELTDLGTKHTLLATQLQATREQEESSRSRAEALFRDLQGVRADLEVLREQAAVVAEVRDLVRRELAALREERDHLAARLDEQAAIATTQGERLARAERDLGQARQTCDTLQNELAETRSQLARWRADHASASTRADELRTALDRESDLVRQHQDAIRQLERKNASLGDAAYAASRDLKKLERSREFRIGNFLWNKLPLSYMSRRGKKWYHRILDAKDRLSLWLGRKYGKSTAEGVAVVASCWHWPIYSHTFVYQEMIGLTHMGLDVKMFHWADNDASELQPAFAYLADHRTVIKPVWENHVRDKAHFDKTKPGRLRALLERIAEVTGKSADDLEKEPYVLQACTFARMAELAGARYIHTYFFYDQTFMGLVASWLLEIPRGISCYADHMLDDFPFKMVGLQIELASVVVATSARIKTELSKLSGGKYDDRIVVKPNGVDGGRFPLTPRPPRNTGDLFEVVSVSRIEPKKGLIHLAEAVAMLKKRGHKVRAHVIGAHDPHNKGSLEYSEALKARITELGLQEDVVMHGMKMQEEIRPILQRSRAFVAPYVELSTGDKDGIPTAMLEAMASALPVVTTDSGSILEVVDHEVEALVVPQRDSTAFAAALERIIQDQKLEKRLSTAARARFDRQFDIKVTERPLHARIAQLLAESKVGTAS